MPGLKITKIFSMVDDTKANFHATQDALLEGMLLAALVVFLFLRDWRATLISAAAMPLSLIPTFFVISFFGFSLNVVTLLALTLVIGILVDDAIVEIENIQKRTLAGYTPLRAAMEGRRRDRPGGAGDHGVDRRGVPADLVHGRHAGTVLHRVRHHGRGGGDILAAGRALRHSADGGLFPQAVESAPRRAQAAGVLREDAGVGAASPAHCVVHRFPVVRRARSSA